MDEIKIRKAVVEDAFMISSVIRDSYISNVAEFNSENGSYFFVRVQSPKYYKKKIQDFRTLFVAEKNNSIIGVIGIHERLFTFFILDEYQKIGLGKKLFLEAIKDWSKNNEQEILLVNASANAVEFYKKLGFESNGEMKIENDIKSFPMAGIVQELIRRNTE
jgi:predicted GNAT family N-acyltransferase